MITALPILNVIALADMNRRGGSAHIDEYPMVMLGQEFGAIHGPALEAMVRAYPVERVVRATIVRDEHPETIHGIIDDDGMPTPSLHRRLLQAMGAYIEEA